MPCAKRIESQKGKDRFTVLKEQKIRQNLECTVLSESETNHKGHKFLNEGLHCQWNEHIVNDHHPAAS